MEEFLQLHEPQLLSSNVPQHFWPSLYEKVSNQLFDSGTAFQLDCLDYDGSNEDIDFMWQLVATKSIAQADPNAIFLVDHAWTFRPDMMRAYLSSIEGLLDRLGNMLGIQPDADDKLEKVMRLVWLHANFYSVGGQQNVEDQMPIWYVNDELGSAVRHSDENNFRLVPFIYIPEQITYSLLFPVKDVSESEKITRDFAEGITDPELRKVVLLPWQPIDLSAESYAQVEPSEDYFLKGRVEETLPGSDASPIIDFNKPLQVFTQYEMVKEHLKDPGFEIVGTEEEADIWWLVKHFKGYKEMSERYPNKFVNQFPFENVITVKDLLYLVARRSCEQVFNT